MGSAAHFLLEQQSSLLGMAMSALSFMFLPITTVPCTFTRSTAGDRWESHTRILCWDVRRRRMCWT
ncbi:hypothetical protein BHD05_03625 [Marisediminicola antarctica]|uniref:Uncharacterized protein n=1 Tax=Marisediminicola antarctica TaxID=674079 RepID=A0A7L5AHK1_9MICO|nr:hypothetical protein BHD05_03625 [Marisediminicola antarctica]